MPSNVSDNIADRFELGSPDIPNIQHAFELIARSYRLHPDPQSFNIDAQQVIDWVQSNLNDEERASLKQQLGKITGNTKEAISDRVLEALDYLHTKLLTQDKKINLATVQELVQQWEEAEAQLQKQGDPADKLVAKYHKLRTVRVVSASIASRVEQEIATTPPQRSPIFDEFIAESFKDIPKADQISFHKKLAELNEKVSTASPEEYRRLTQELVDHVEKATGKPIPASLKKDVLAYFPPPAPLTDKIIINHLEALKTPEEKAEYLQTQTASHLTSEQAALAAQTYTQHDIATTSTVFDTIRNFSHNQKLSEKQLNLLIQELLPSTLETHTKEAVQKLNSQAQVILPQLKTEQVDAPGSLSKFTEDLIFSKEFASSIASVPQKDTLFENLITTVHPSTVLSDADFLSEKTGISPDQITNLLIQTKSNVLTQIATPEYAQKYIAYLGITDFDPDRTREIANSVLEVFTNPTLSSSRPHIVTLLSTIPKDSSKYIQKTTLDVVANDFSKIVSNTFPTNSPEAKILTGLIHPIARGLSVSPETAQQTLISTIKFTNYLSPSANTTETLRKLSPIIDTLRTVHPTIKLFTSSTASILQSHTGLTPAQLIPITNQFTLRYILNSSSDPELFRSYFEKSILPQLESLVGKPLASEKGKDIFADLHTHLKTNPLRLSPDKQVLSSLVSHFTKAGLTPNQARALAPELLKSAQIGYFFAGFTPLGKNLVHNKALQAKAFNDIFKVAIDSQIAANPALKNLQFNYLNSRRIFEDLHGVFGNPAALSPDFLVKLQSPAVFTFTKYIESYIPEPIRPAMANAAKTLLGSSFLTSKFAEQTGLRDMFSVLASGPTKFRPFGVISKFMEMRSQGKTIEYLKFLNKYTGMKVAANPVALAFRKNFQTPLSALTKGAWTKFAATSAGKTIVAMGTKLASNALVNSVLQALGSAAPIIGNLIALAVSWIVGDLLIKLINPMIKSLKYIKENVIPAVTGLILMLGSSFAGISFLPSAMIGLGGAAMAGGIQSAIGGKSIGLTSNAVSGGVSRFNYIVGTIATSAVSSTLSGAIAAVIAIPMVVAFFIFIITSSALVIPPTVYNVGDGVGFQNNSSCPLSSGRISTYSYSDSIQEVEGSGARGHGTNGYWREMEGVRDCYFHIPSDGVSCAPQVGSTNYCYLNPRCSTGNERSPFYGYAIDVTSSDRRVFLPQVNGQSPTWEYLGLVFQCNDAGCPHKFRTTTSDGTVYILNFLHLDMDANRLPIINPGPYVSGYHFANLLDQGTNTHLHLEVNIDNVYVKPENYFCGASNVIPSGFITVNCAEPGPYGTGYTVSTASFQNRYQAPGQINPVSRLVGSNIYQRVRDIVDWGDSRGYQIYVDAGYRDYSTQLNLCTTCQASGTGCNAERAEYSQHRTGRAIDIYEVSSGTLRGVPQDEVMAAFPWLTHPVAGDRPHYCVSLQPGDCDPL